MYRAIHTNSFHYSTLLITFLVTTQQNTNRYKYILYQQNLTLFMIQAKTHKQAFHQS